MKSRPLLYRCCLLFPAVLVMALGLYAPIHGNFYFRQAHVAANIEKYLADGLSLIPSTYNFDIPYKLFDFPLFQLIAAFLSKTLGADPLVVARVLSILCFVLAFYVIDRLLARSSTPFLQRLFVLLFFSYAPMNLFFFDGPMVDGMAILLSLVSLYAFVRWVESSPTGEKHWFLVVTVVSGVLSALVKNPVYLPVFIAVLLFAVTRRGWRGVTSPGIVIYILAVGSAVVLFKLLSNTVNDISGFLSSTEAQAYFGPAADRLDPRSWHRIGAVVATQVLNPLTVVLSIAGIALFTTDSSAKYKSLYLGLLLGSLATLLVFFNRHTWHNYYQLPFVFPLAFFAGYAVFRLSRYIEKAQPLGRYSTLGRTTFLVSVTAFTLYYSGAHYTDLTGTPTDWIARNGEWIREHSQPTDFVIYALDTADPEDWNPVFLYFAKRDGYNLPRRRVKQRVLAPLRWRYAHHYARVLLFCPSDLFERLRSSIETSGGKLIEAGPPGMLYWLVAPSPDPGMGAVI